MKCMQNICRYNYKVFKRILASIYYGEKYIGVSFLDISTGDFFVSQGNIDYVNKLVQSFSPSEILYQKTTKKRYFEDFGSNHFSYPIEDWPYSYDYSYELLINQFKTKTLKGFVNLKKY